MNLAVDIGNTRTRAAVFSQSELIEAYSVETPTVELAERITDKFPGIQYAIVSSVNEPDTDLVNYISKKVQKYVELNASTPTPVKNLYQTPETLGKDRLAALVGAFTVFPATNLLIIDTGTAITYDFLGANNEYSGGNISPGMDMRFKALNHYTGKLPREKAAEGFPEMGFDTKTAIISGVINGILYEMEAYISIFSAKYKELKTILTGGDANFFDKKLKKTIFVIPNLTLIGLNCILQYNEKTD
ncbi:MAG: type III pantothenate kinase [Bacteroidales bacterium]|nr:type III pantothenate kinase [Bacteroidales bacterium]